MSADQAPKIVIIGAGASGLSFAIALKRQLCFENFMIFERASSVGGTWRDNVYPGCTSDITAHFYSLSTDLNPSWSCSHPPQPELEAYWNQLSERHSLYPHITFNRMVTAARWDSEKNIYHITTQDTKTGAQVSTTAHILISALGILEVPKLPDIPGMSDFKGSMFHSARWVDIPMTGKRVAVIGNGASASQFLPIISQIPNIQVTQFCRTPSWIFPTNRFSSSYEWIFTKFPFMMRLLRVLLFLKFELTYYIVFHNPIFRRVLTKIIRLYMKQKTPVKYHKVLVPEYDLGCKRVTFNTGYFAALHRDNVELNWQGVSSFVDGGIMTNKGEYHPYDVIILATGYTTDKYPLIVHGVKGQSIQEYHNAQNGPTAYLGTSTPGFPNFYQLCGPNTATGYISVIFALETQINYILKLVRPILDQKIASLDVSVTATDEYNSKIQARMSDSVFVHCHSWYRVGGTGKIGSIFPGTSTLFWWWLRKPNWDHYCVGGNSLSDRWEPSRSISSVMGFRTIMGVLGLIGVWCMF
ncbi:hypothetical protein BDZ94DRAFT_1251379 [Collybia nuda]|uniref:Flavin-containing monooxygenase n=1 Tax=Collybia nuda TaxID=64659 RepID=A0A9P5YCA9_9AGAR|nr:hypothetical protein BDZ94DRAFT_1251379 [Collybia nuda]